MKREMIHEEITTINHNGERNFSKRKAIIITSEEPREKNLDEAVQHFKV